MTGVEEVAIVAALTAAAAGTAAYSASERNKAIRKAAGTTKAAAELQARQLMEAAQIERYKASLKAEQVRGRLRVAAASAGLGNEFGSFSALTQQNAMDEAMNQAIIQYNQQAQVNAVLSGGAADIARLMAQRENALLAGIQGGIQGAQTGLAIGGAIRGLGSAVGSPTSVENIGGMGGAPSYGGGFGPTTGGYGAPTAFT